MAHHMRKLVIAAFAILAFAVSNFAMVSSGMAHGTDSSGHHLTADACEAVHEFGAAGHVDDHDFAGPTTPRLIHPASSHFSPLSDAIRDGLMLQSSPGLAVGGPTEKLIAGQGAYAGRPRTCR
jgi:hypothetical protein